MMYAICSSTIGREKTFCYRDIGRGKFSLRHARFPSLAFFSHYRAKCHLTTPVKENCSSIWKYFSSIFKSSPHCYYQLIVSSTMSLIVSLILSGFPTYLHIHTPCLFLFEFLRLLQLLTRYKL